MEREHAYKIVKELNRLSESLENAIKTDTDTPFIGDITQIENVSNDMDMLVSYLELSEDKDMITRIDVGLKITGLFKSSVSLVQ